MVWIYLQLGNTLNLWCPLIDTIKSLAFSLDLFVLLIILFVDFVFYGLDEGLVEDHEEEEVVEQNGLDFLSASKMRERRRNRWGRR